MATGTAILIGSAVAALGAVGAAGINAASQSSTNKSQKDMFRQQMAYQTSEREAAQQYNNPVNQRQRFEAAGVNPYFSLSNIDSGSTTAQSAPGAPTLQAPQYGNILSALTDAIPQGISNFQGFEQLQQLQLGVEQMKVDTRYKLTQKLMDIVEQRVRIQGSKLSNEEKSKNLAILDKSAQRLQQDIDFTNQTWDERTKTIVAQRKLAENESDAKELGNEYQKMVNEMFPKLSQAQLESINASVESSLSSALASKAAAGLSNAQAATEAVNKINKELEGKGMKLDQSQKRGLYKFTTEALKLENRHKELVNKNQELENRGLQIGPIKLRPSQGMASYQDRIDSQRYKRRKQPYNSPARLNTHLTQ